VATIGSSFTDLGEGALGQRGELLARAGLRRREGREEDEDQREQGRGDAFQVAPFEAA
jgi:hypothetical protein